MASKVFQLGDRITLLPVLHGSGDCALSVRALMLEERFDALAVPLPASFQATVEQGVLALPAVSLAAQADRSPWSGWSPEEREYGESPGELGGEGGCDDDDPDQREFSYVPLDPCQPVIMALRVALGERMPRYFLDLETRRFQPYAAVLPDPYALKQVQPERFAAAVLPSIPPLPPGQPRDRVRTMAARLRELEERHDRILSLCNVLDWPWLRQAYLDRLPPAPPEEVEEVESFGVEQATLIFLLGELPFITALYERARGELEDDSNLSIDGVKELLLAARANYREELKGRARAITPHLLSQCLKYIRNLSLLDRRMTPDLYSIVIAAQQTAGDRYALHVAEAAREYSFACGAAAGGAAETAGEVAVGLGRGRLPNGELVKLVSRLPGHPICWRGLQLKRRPEQRERRKWEMEWNPYAQCSYPPEDERIEDFRSRVFERARQIMGADLIRTEKFTTSIKDGIDIRDTLRNWHTGEIYVRELPPARGRLDCAVMLFDSPADPRDYPWRSTWYAEHEEESTLAFFATDFHREIVGPGIALSTYGGCLFLFPPVSIPDIWRNPELDYAETLEERLVAAALHHSRSPHIALLAPAPPGAGWRRLAKQYKKTLVHVPLGQFSQSTVAQLRMMHVLNGKHIRSYAAEFIRKA